MTGMIDGPDGRIPGKILALWLELRRSVGIVEAKAKQGVKFKVRSAEDLIDKIRDKCNDLGILIYPNVLDAKLYPVEDGTLAEQRVEVVAQAVEDGSYLTFSGYGLGADNQDKAGGKAGTYAFKQALIQALLAGGKENAKALGVVDTDDSGAPIAGGVKQLKPGKAKGPSDSAIAEAFDKATDEASYREAVKLLMSVTPERQLKAKDLIKATQDRLGIVPGGVKKALTPTDG